MIETRKDLKKYRRLLTEVELLKRQLEKIEPEFVRDSVSGSASEFPISFQVNPSIYLWMNICLTSEFSIP